MLAPDNIHRDIDRDPGGWDADTDGRYPEYRVPGRHIQKKLGGPVCGKVNRSLYLEETDGWMECEYCGKSTQDLRFAKARRDPGIPNGPAETG